MTSFDRHFTKSIFMGRSFLCVLFFLLSLQLSAQKVIISGKEGNRPLVWSDFQGRSDESNPFFALTHWNINYKPSDIRVSGENVTVGSFDVTVELDRKESWVKKGKETDELLEHEQGHFNIGLLCMKELLTKEKEASFTKSNLSSKMQSIFSDVMKKYHDMDDKYDSETDHSKNKPEQKRWNEFLKEQALL